MTQNVRDEEIRLRLYAKIEANQAKKYWTKVKTLLSEFGFQASSRVRQTSLGEVLDKLDAWGLEYDRNGSFRADDYITMWRRAPGEKPRTKMRSVPPPASGAPFVASFDPLHFAFRVGGTHDEARSQAHAHDIMAAIWSMRPVCLLVNASDELFSFLGGLLSAVMRRRALMVRSSSFTIETLPLGPQILTLGRLKRALGMVDEIGETVPAFGAVYLVRDDLNDVRDDELSASLRELFVPHAHRLEGRFNGPASQSPEFAKLVEWLAAFAGGRGLSASVRPELTDLASLFADAAQAQDVLLDRATLSSTDGSFRAGYESTEHMAIKSALLKHLRAAGHDVVVEEGVDVLEDDELVESSRTGVTRPQKCRPDLRVKGKIWVEVETLRSLAIRGSSPFFALENKMRRRLDAMKGDAEAWLIVPSDVATLAPRHLAAIAKNLATPGGPAIKWGFADLLAGTPVFVEVADPPRAEVQMRGESWREGTRTAQAEQKLTWADVAGYSDLRERLKQDVLQPLVDPEPYAECGLTNANGLLLFGLPGCGKSLIGRVLAGVADLTCRRLVPSDLTSMWIGEGVAKIREVFDWALKQRSCLIVLDEIDAVAPQRQEHNMHADEKRQVNELLAQLDRIAGKPVMVVGTTNYVRGIDSAIRRSGRFDVKLPVFPPNENDRRAIFEYYLGPRLQNVHGASSVDTAELARATPLFTPADIKTVVESTVRRAIYQRAATAAARPAIDTGMLLEVAKRHPRAIQHAAAEAWLAEAKTELGADDAPHLEWLSREIRVAYPQV